MKPIIILFLCFSTLNSQEVVTDSARPIIDVGPGDPVDPVDPIICPENELLVPCGSFCPDGCLDNELIRCPIDLSPFPCHRCACRFGFRRNNLGICVPKEECDQINGCNGDPNAVPTICGSSCPLTCENFQKPPQFCIAVCSKSPCECKPGYVLDNNGKCVLPTECPFIPRCPVNQTWNWCPRSCPPEQTCKDYITGLIIDCPPPPIDEISAQIFCRPRCECRDGYIRKTPGGDCILPYDCCDDPNAEIVDCVNPCAGGTCEKPDFEPCQFLVCNRGCQCKKGYVKDSLGKCVLPTSCPRPCPRNEIWNPFPNLCARDRTCSSILQGVDILPICTILPIRGRCECRPGFVRINGTCLPENLCCTLNDPNTVITDCPTICDCTCRICPIPECRVPCRNKGCICRPGYVRDNNGRCINPRLCRITIGPIDPLPIDV